MARTYKNHLGLPYALLLASLQVAVLLFSSDSAAEVYKCPGANAAWVFSGTPYPNGFVQGGKQWISIQEYQKFQAERSSARPGEDKGSGSTPHPLESEYHRELWDRIEARRKALIKEAEQLRATQKERLQRAPQTVPKEGKAALLPQQTSASKAVSTAQELAWERLIEAGKAAYQKRDIATGAQHFLAALQLAQTFDKEGARNGNPYEVSTFQNMVESLNWTTLEEATREYEASQGNPEAYEKLISERTKRTKEVYAVLEPFLKDALRLTETVRGPEHPSVYMALKNLANCYEHVGRYQEAVSLYERLFASLEKHTGQPAEIKLEPSGFGFDHTYFALRIKGAAWMEAALKHMIKISEKAHGPDHPEIAVAVAYLGHLYKEQGRAAEAKTMDQKALVLAEKAQGAGSPKSIEGLFHQAYNALQRHSYAEAEKLYLETRRLTEQSYGPEDVKDLPAIKGLAWVYEKQGRYAEAETYYQKYLQLTEKLYRPDARQVHTAVNMLAQYYASQKRYADAAPLYERALALVEKNRSHGSGVLELDRLAQTYLSLGRRADAEPLLKRALAMVENRNDPPGHRGRYLVLGEIAFAAGRIDEAEHFYQRALNTDPQVNTANERLDSIEPRGKLADFYVSQKRYAEAEELYKRNLHQVERFRSLWHNEKVNPFMDLVDFYTSQNQFITAESLLKSTLEKSIRAYGEGPETGAIRTKLVELLLVQGRKAEADALLNQAPVPRPIPGMRSR